MTLLHGKLKTGFRFLLAAVMMLVGIVHFTDPNKFVQIVPNYLPSPLLLVYISGFFEFLGGIGLLVPRTTRSAAWGLIALYIAVFPANVNMALHQLPFDGKPVPPLFLWIRLPVQLIFIAWAYWFTRRGSKP